MTGVAFGWPGPEEKSRYDIEDVPRFVFLEPGEFKGRQVEFWRRWELPLERRYEMADAIAEVIGHTPRELSGFTLFWNGDKREGRTPSWQMSIRQRGEDGWSVSRITEAEAQAVLRILEPIGNTVTPMRVEHTLRTILEMAAEAREAGNRLLAAGLAG